jgi:hypothetical protein
MKKKWVFVVVPVILVFLSFVLVFSACGSPGDEGSAGKPGKLTIAGLPSNYSAFSCQVYLNPQVEWQYDPTGALVMTYYGETFASGTNTDYNDNPMPYNELSISDGNYSDDFVYTGAVSILLHIVDGTSGSKWFGINNVQFSGGKATINWTDFSFVLPDTDGEFKLTGAGEYNNKYAIVVGTFGTDPVTALYGFNGASSLTALKGFKIEGGIVELPIYKITAGTDTSFRPYSGDDTATSLAVIILDSEVFDYEHYAANPTTYQYILYADILGSTEVSFVNGKAEKAVSDGAKYNFGP